MSRLGRALGQGKLFQEKRGRGKPLWYLDWKDGKGQRRRQALSPDKRVAERMRTEIISQRDLELAGLGSVEGQSRPLAEIVPLYLQDLAQRAGEKQVLNVTIHLRRILASLRSKRVRDLDPVELMQYRSARLKLGLSNRTINVEVGSLKAMLRWAENAGLIAQSPIRNFKPLPYTERHRRHVRRALSDQEIKALLDAARADDDEQAANRAAETTIGNGTKGSEYDERRRLPRVPQRLLFTALLEAGSRWTETISATWADLDRERATMRLRATTTKSGRTRVVPLRTELVAELWALRAVHQRARQRLVQASDRVFLSPEGADWKRETNNPRRLLDRILERAGIARQTADGVVDLHSLRHSAASRMARHGVPLIVAARVLGHASTEITSQVYVHTTSEDLRVAVIPTDRAQVRTQTA
ncbi:MAG: site-specific integrase [Actinobacteria bacterium]|nr:site-specific integrase [Actinomycetota bacterium]